MWETWEMIIKVITVNKNHFIHSPSLFNSSVKYLLLLLNFFILLNIPFIISSFLFTNWGCDAKFLVVFCVFNFLIIFSYFSCFLCLFRCIFFLGCVRLCIVWIRCLCFLFLLLWISGVSCFVLYVQMVVLLFLIVFCRFFVPSLFPFSVAFWFWKGFHSLELFCNSFYRSRFLS